MHDTLYIIRPLYDPSTRRATFCSGITGYRFQHFLCNYEVWGVVSNRTTYSLLVTISFIILLFLTHIPRYYIIMCFLHRTGTVTTAKILFFSQPPICNVIFVVIVGITLNYHSVLCSRRSSDYACNQTLTCHIE